MSVPKTFTINLDESPEHRWTEVVNSYKDKFPRVIEEIDNILQSVGYLGNMALWLCNAFSFFGSIMYSKELKSIASLSGVPLNKLILMQICYEMFSACTSLVIKKDNGSNVHFRTMDWEMDFLKDLTINVNFIRGGKTVFRGVTWAGYVGIVTGMNWDYSIALNYRRSNGSGSLMKNLLRTISMKWPIGYLIRHTLENSSHGYEETMNIFKKYKLISPCYITICSGEGDACVIVRDCDKVVDVNYLAYDSRYIVQTNCDDVCDLGSVNIMWSRERVMKVNDIMGGFNVNNATIDDIFSAFSVSPIINSHTIYSSVMIPKLNMIESKIV